VVRVHGRTPVVDREICWGRLMVEDHQRMSRCAPAETIPLGARLFDIAAERMYLAGVHDRRRTWILQEWLACDRRSNLIDMLRVAPRLRTRAD
jgi:hypothetical protein